MRSMWTVWALCAGIGGPATALAATAPNEWLVNGQAASAPNLAASDPFAVQQLATTDPDRLFANWNRPGAAVNVGATQTMKRNQAIVTVIIFTGCAPNASGFCNVTVDFETVSPSGAIYDRTVGAKVWVGRAPPRGRSLELSEGALGLRVEDKDPLGPYTVRAAITDHVAGKTLRTSQVLTATP